MATALRPSPSESATLFSPGTKKIGNDGNGWMVVQSSGGVKRWVKQGGISAKFHARSSAVSTPQITSPSAPKFKIGDVVKVIYAGSGAPPEDINKIVRITKLGAYGLNKYPGYQVHPPIGNSRTGFYNGFIDERTFELVSESQNLNTSPTTQIKPNKQYMAKIAKSITKKTTQEVRSIETSLINKEEVFKMLALAEATGLPLLLVGEPGVAKTKTIIEYAKAWLNKDGKMTAEDFQNKMFILETDEGTKASEIKGMPDLGKLFTENKYDLNTPIADADIVIINEVDKASSAIRNAMLGVMNEKFLFNGKHKIPCKWKLFIATCNEIPKEEVNSPFWDRFMLKMTVNRVSAGEMSKYYSKGAREYREKFKIGIPNQAEIDSMEITTNKLDKYLEVGYQNSSDRTLTFVPRLAKAVAYVWDISVDRLLCLK